MPAPSDFALGDIQYGNNSDQTSGRYQAIHFSGWTAAQDVTAGTPDSTIFALPAAPPLESIEILEVVVQYPAASGAVSTPAQLIPGKYAAGTNTPFVPIYEGYVSNANAGMYVASEANIPVNSVRKYSLAHFTASTFQQAQVGKDAYNYPQLSPGDIPNMQLHTAGVGGTQSLLFGYTYRERYVSPVASTMATAGTNTSFS